MKLAFARVMFKPHAAANMGPKVAALLANKSGSVVFLPTGDYVGNFVGGGWPMAEHGGLDRANSQHALPDVLYITRTMALEHGRADWYCKPGWYRRRSATSEASWITAGPFESEAEALAG